MGNYQKIEKAITYISNNFKTQPSLKEIASIVDLSEFHFQRIFTQWAGISPKKFMQFLTIEYAKIMLRESQPLLNVAYDSGFSSTSRLHDLFVTIEGMTPGEYKKSGRGLIIKYGFYNSPFGKCLVSVTKNSICGLIFIKDISPRIEIEKLHTKWPESIFKRDDTLIKSISDQIFDRSSAQRKIHLKCFVKGTKYQLKVWQALLKIPFGKLTSYQEIAKLSGNQESSRAAASAIGSNPIAYLIPCHRVILKSGNLSGYRWGVEKKRAIIGWEAAHNKLVIDKSLQKEGL